MLIDGITETVKHDRKQQESGFLTALLAPLVTSLVQPKRNQKSKKRMHR